MLWLLCAFLTALCESLKDVVMKKSLGDANEYVVAWAWVFFSLPFLLPAVWYQGIPPLGEQFWLALGCGGGLNFIAFILYVKALKYGDLSLTVPMIAFSPLFLLLTAPLVLGEFPTVWGMLGVLLVVVGSYLLNLREKHKGYLAPYRALLSETGPRMMLGVALIWGIATTIDKVGLQNSAPVFWVAALNGVLMVALTPVMLNQPGSLGQVQRHFKALVLIGFLAALAALFQMFAVAMTLVAYVIAIKRTSTLMSVAWGYLFFGEAGLSERIAGAVVMLAGILCMTLL